MRRVLPLAVAFGVLLAAGCAPDQIREDRPAFDAAYVAFQAGQWQAAVDGFTKYLRSCPTTPTRGEVYYYRGEALVHLKQPQQARADFERAIGAQAPEPILSFARVAIGNLYYESGNDAKAVETYAQVLREPRKELPLDMIVLRTAVSLQRLGKWATADKYLSYLLDNYPDSAAAIEARRRIHADSFSVQTGAYASAAAAQSEADRLREAGFDARVMVTRKGAQVLHAVQVGRTQTHADAMALVRRVSAAGFAALVVP